MGQPREALVLVSGGIDSAATLALYLKKDFAVSAVFVDYEQPARLAEEEAAARICGHYSVPLSIVRCNGLGRMALGYIRGRNSLLVQLALARASFDTGQIGIGIIDGSGYPDCSRLFVKECQDLLDLYCDGRVQLVAPFVNDNKLAVMDYCRINKVPIDLTYSCEAGATTPCGQCPSCKDLEALHAA